MRTTSLSSFGRKLRGYKHTPKVVSFLRRARRRPDLAALFVFGSLAKADFHEHSDADICVILKQPTVDPTLRDVDAFWRDAPPGIVELHLYGSDQFHQMIGRANGLALEVMDYGLILGGDPVYLRRIEQLFHDTRRRLGLTRVDGGWDIRPKRRNIRSFSDEGRTTARKTRTKMGERHEPGGSRQSASSVHEMIRDQVQ